MSPRWLRRRELIPYVILLTALLLTAGSARYAYDSAIRQDTLRFATTAEATRGAIQARLDAYIAILLSGAGLFAASAEVTRDEFGAYVARLALEQRYPGIQGIGFCRLIKAEERAGVLAAARREIPSFEFWPRRPAGDITAIVYLEPPDVRNEFALGYDMATEPVRWEAMRRARDHGEPAATSRVRLVQEDAAPGDEQAGFLIYVPVYRGGAVPESVEERRQRLQGFLYSPFRADDLLAGVIAPELRVQLGFDVFDGEPTDGQLLHRTRAHEPERFTVERELEVAGRTWTLVLRGGEDVRVSGGQPVVALVAAGGTVLSLLLFAVTRGQVVARLAAERTAEILRRSEEKLREADRAKDEFLATISHELRTPLNAIVGWTSMLGSRTVPADMQAHAINVIARNAAAQTRLVEDLLDMSRAVAGHLMLRIGTVDARATLQAAADAVAPLAADAGLALRVELAGTLGTLEADGSRLQQIVTNLLSNAIKFTPAGGQITLAAERTGETLAVRVADTGIGIDPAFMPFLFERFRQADSSSTRMHAGAGLGLAIARHLAHLHGGTLEAVSAGVDQGATFIVRLPIRQQTG